MASPPLAVLVDLGALAGRLGDLELERVAVARELVGLAEAHAGGREPSTRGWLARNAERAVVDLDGGGLHLLVELAEQVVALVQQVVGRLARTQREGDLCVQAGQLLGQRVDHGLVVLELQLGVLLQVAELGAGVRKREAISGRA
jgi:hypothetical protein